MIRLVNEKYYVYVWFIKDTREIFYVGKGSGRRASSMKDRNEYFKNIRSKHDCDFEIVKYFDVESDAYNYEKKYGMELKSQGLARACYILGQTNKYISSSVRNKISKTLTGRPSSTKGTHLSEEHKAKLRAAHLGKKQSAEHRAAIGRALCGRIYSDETRRKLSNSLTGKRNPMYGHSLSEDHKRKIALSNMGHLTSKETRAKIGISNGKPVVQYDKEMHAIKTYCSASEAARELSLHTSKICCVCRGTRNATGGFKFKYVEQGNTEESNQILTAD